MNGYRAVEVEGALSYIADGDADGAMPHGTRVKKCNSEEGDGTPDGSLGTVFSSLLVPPYLEHEHHAGGYFYFVLWDHMPQVPVGVMARKIRELQEV